MWPVVAFYYPYYKYTLLEFFLINNTSYCIFPLLLYLYVVYYTDGLYLLNDCYYRLSSFIRLIFFLLIVLLVFIFLSSSSYKYTFPLNSYKPIFLLSFYFYRTYVFNLNVSLFYNSLFYIFFYDLPTILMFYIDCYYFWLLLLFNCSLLLLFYLINVLGIYLGNFFT